MRSEAMSDILQQPQVDCLTCGGEEFQFGMLSTLGQAQLVLVLNLDSPFMDVIDLLETIKRKLSTFVTCIPCALALSRECTPSTHPLFGDLMPTHL